MDSALMDARMEVASEIGADVGSFTPPEEKRFTGIEIMLGIGGAMLYAFFESMAKKIAEKVGEKVGEKIGEPLGEFVDKKIDQLIGKDKSSQDRLLEDAHSEAKRQIQSAGLTDEQIATIAEAIESGMTVSLSERATKDVSIRIARTVKLAALKTL